MGTHLYAYVGNDPVNNVDLLGLKKYNYRETFAQANPNVNMDDTVVHHAVEQQVKQIYPNRFTEEELNSPWNLRGIPKSENSDLHLRKIRDAWDDFYEQHPQATREQILAKARDIDELFGERMNPAVNGSRIADVPRPSSRPPCDLPNAASRNKGGRFGGPILMLRGLNGVLGLPGPFTNDYMDRLLNPERYVVEW